jgi:hypothetical protein
MKRFKNRITHCDELLDVYMQKDPNTGSVDMSAFTQDGEPWCDISKVVVGARCERNHCYVKDYSENEGILAALEAAGIVKRTGATGASGFVELHYVEVLGELA